MVCRCACWIAFGTFSAAQDFFLERQVSSVSMPVRQPTTDNFEAQCASDDDHGWPRFHSVDELSASPWTSYFMAVYGELPSTYPVCIHDLWFLNADAYEAANITGHEVVPAADIQEGDLFRGNLGLQIYHDVYEPLPANTWTEIAHSVIPTEVTGMWVWRLRGSGVWANSGNTIVFPTPANVAQTHREALDFMRANCSVSISWRWPRLESDILGSCAREKGYDSIQFEPQEGMAKTGVFGEAGLTEMVLVNSDGDKNCGTDDPSQTELRSGWMASRKCDCENHEIADTCGLMPYSTMGPFTDPPMCEIKRRRPWRPCNPGACEPTTCKLPTK